MAREQKSFTEAVILMEHDPASRLEIMHTKLRRQVVFFQLVSLLFCAGCCLFTVMHHVYPAMCTGNFIETAPTMQMLHQDAEERGASLTRLTVKKLENNGKFSKDGIVPWTPATQHSNDINYFTLREDGESVIVNRTGMYKVSLQITYRGLSGKTGDLTLHHDIWHITERYGKILLLTNMESVNFTTSHWKKTLFSGDIFFLEKGDELEVFSTSLSYIDVGQDWEQKHFFVLCPHVST